MFDEVIFNCPHCQAQITVQSEAGPRTRQVYHADDVPMAIASTLDGKLLHCDRCTGQWFIRIRQAQYVPCDLISPAKSTTAPAEESWLKS